MEERSFGKPAKIEFSPDGQTWFPLVFESKYILYSKQMLEDAINKAIDEENYEEASAIKNYMREIENTHQKVFEGIRTERCD